MKKTSIFFLIIIFCVGIFAKVNLAQMPTCAVKIVVKSEDGVLVKDADATATSYETKKLYKAVLKNGMPFFPALNSDGYEFSITKAGFKRSVGGILVECKSENDTLEVKVSEGDGKEVFDITVRPQGRELTAEEKELVKKLSTTTDETERSRLPPDRLAPRSLRTGTRPPQVARDDPLSGEDERGMTSSKESRVRETRTHGLNGGARKRGLLGHRA